MAQMRGGRDGDGDGFDGVHTHYAAASGAMVRWSNCGVKRLAAT
jgi:hypothetical protein